MTVPVVHIITMLELGGAQQNTLHTVANLDRRRFAPQLVCGPGGLLDDAARALPDVPVHFVPDLVRPIRPLRDRAARRAITRLLRPLADDGPVIVHTHSSKAGILGRQAARRAGAGPVVHTVHGFGHDAIRQPLLRRIALAVERRAATGTDAFLTVASCHAERGRRDRLFGDAPVHIVRSGIDVDDFARADSLRTAARVALELPAEAPVVGMLACLKPQKAPVDFVEIAARVLRERDDAHFFLAGDGELRQAVELRCAQLGLGRRLRLLGWRRDIPELLGALDVLLLTSRWEGLPRVCPQAMAAGRPIVGTRVDGVPEAVVDDRNGYLYEPGNLSTAARRLVELLGNPGLRERFAAAGREAVEEFRQERMVSDQERIYGELLAARSARTG